MIKYFIFPTEVKAIYRSIRKDCISVVSNSYYQQDLDVLLASSAWSIKDTDLWDTCKVAWLSPPHKRIKLDVYRGKLVSILANISEILYICLRHKITEGSVEVFCDGDSELKISQDSYKFHPVDRDNSDFCQGYHPKQDKAGKVEWITLFLERHIGTPVQWVLMEYSYFNGKIKLQIQQVIQ